MRMEMRKVIGVLVVLATSGAEAVLARAVSPETSLSEPSTTDGSKTCKHEGGSTCPAPVVYNPEVVKAFAESKMRELQKESSNACQALLIKNEGDIERFDGQNEQYYWDGELIKVKGNCEVLSFRLSGKEMGLRKAGPNDADAFSCGNQGCKFLRSDISLYWLQKVWVTADTLSTGSQGRKYRSLIPEESELTVITKLPRPASGCCEGAKKCRVIPPKLEETKTHYSGFSEELQNAIAGAIAGGTTGLHSIPTPVCHVRSRSVIPQVDEDPAPPFCDESYDDRSVHQTINRFSYKETIPVQVGATHKEGSTIEFCYPDEQASTNVFVGEWFELFE